MSGAGRGPGYITRHSNGNAYGQTQRETEEAIAAMSDLEQKAFVTKRLQNPNRKERRYLKAKAKKGVRYE